MASLRMVAVALVALAGCMPMAPVYVSHLTVAPPTLMVAKKAPAPLYIVLDPAKVPDKVVIAGGELKPVDVFELHTFVRRDLKRAMEAFFHKVEVVGPEFAPPPRAWVADVRVDNLALAVNKAADPSARYVAAQIFGQMTWAFALRRVEADEYAYSFAGTSVGTYSMANVADTPRAFASAFEVAVASMVRGFVDKGVDTSAAKPPPPGRRPTGG